MPALLSRLRPAVATQLWVARDRVAATAGGRTVAERPAGPTPAQIGDAAASVLDALGEPRLRVSVTLSNALVRMATLPPTRRLARDEASGLARSALLALHGEVVQDWRVTFELPGGGRGGVAAAADPRLIEALIAAGARTGPNGRVTLAAIEPLVSLGMRSTRVRRGERWLVALEPGYACVARCTGAGWERLRARALLNDDEDDGLRRLVVQCASGTGTSTTQRAVDVLAPHRGARAPDLPADWSVNLRREPRLEQIFATT